MPGPLKAPGTVVGVHYYFQGLSMKAFRSIVCFLLLVSAPASCASSTTTAGETLTADTRRTTVDGNSFVAPVGWSIRTTGPAVILTAPEGGSHIALVDVAGKDADAAVATAWAAYDPKAQWPLKLASDRVKRDGWDQVRSYAYVTAASDERSVGAQALRHGDRWTVAISDLAHAVGEKRESQVDLVFQRLWPKGYSPESFAGKTAHKLDPARIEVLRQFI